MDVNSLANKRQKGFVPILVIGLVTVVFWAFLFGLTFGFVRIYISQFTGALSNFFGGSGCATSSSPSDGGTGVLHENIITTSFGGCKNGGCADPFDNCRGSGGVSTGCGAPTEYYAALPLGSIPAKCRGNIDNCAKIQVTNPKNNKSLVLAVVDTGPWNTKDSAYVLGTARPQAETGVDTHGRKTNRAGLDISPKARAELVDDKLNWKFTSMPVGVGGGADCGVSTGEVSTATGCSEKIIKTVTAELGGGDNPKYGDHSGGGWCAAFASWAYKTNGLLNVTDAAPISLVQGHPKYLVTTEINGKGGTNKGTAADIKPGDIYTSTYRSINTGGSGYHSGIVVSVRGDGKIETIDGNVSKSVGRRVRSVSEIGWVARSINCR